MKDNSAKLNRISSSRTSIEDILKLNQIAMAQCAALLRKIEEYENHFCRDSVGKELRITDISKVRNIKRQASMSFMALRSSAMLNHRISLAFDDLLTSVESSEK